MRIPFEPVARSLAIDIVYKNDESSSGVVTFDGDYVFCSKEFDGETTLLRVLQQAMEIPNRVDYSYSTEGGQGELQINHKTIFMTHLVSSRQQDLLSSLQTKLAILTTFEEAESENLIEFYNKVIDTVKQAEESLSATEFELFIDQIEEQFEVLFGDEPFQDSGYQSGTYATPDRIESPSIQQLNLPPMEQIVERVTSSLRNVTIFENVAYSEEAGSVD